MKSIVVTEGLIFGNCAFSHTMAYSHVNKRIIFADVWITCFATIFMLNEV